MKRSEDEPYHVTIEIVNKQCKGLRLLEDSGIQQYALSDVRGIPGGLTRHLIRAPSQEIRKTPVNALSKARGYRKIGGVVSVWFDSEGCDVCKTMLSQNAFLISGRHIEGYTTMYNFVTPNFDAFKRIISTLEARGLKSKIREVTKFKPRGKTLTERQERVLWLALKMGFFDYPRKTNTLELSRRLGISLSTLSEITRRGMRRLVEDHFET